MSEHLTITPELLAACEALLADELYTHSEWCVESYFAYGTVSRGLRWTRHSKQGQWWCIRKECSGELFVWVGGNGFHAVNAALQALQLPIETGYYGTVRTPWGTRRVQDDHGWYSVADGLHNKAG